ncbi:MAG: aspartate kinase, partial [Acidimicrobiales bacterium]
MALIVQKFGGTSVGDAERIRAVADHVAKTRAAGHDVVVVVSAMGKFTDELIQLADDVSSNHAAREMDMLLTAGERISMALVSMALGSVGVESASFTGSQAGIITDTSHRRAKILEMRPDRIRDALGDGLVPVVAGFQGVSTQKDVTTLGRGGSDVTAVALAHALGADVCEIYTDVTGVFSADPRVVPKARRLERISFDEMLEIAATGGRVLMLRSVEFARRHRVPLHVRSSFTWEPGTWIVEEDPIMEEAIVSAITDDVSEAKITVAGVPDHPGVAATLFRELADAGINVDMIVQNTSAHAVTDISFTVAKVDLESAMLAVKRVQPIIGAETVSSDDNIGRVTIVGAGMKSSPGVTALMFETLSANGINI